MNTKCHNLTTVRNSFASKASSRADWWHGQFLSKTGHKLVGFRILPSAALRTTEASVVKMRPRNIFCVLCCLPTHSTALSSTSFKLSAMASADPVLGGSHSGCTVGLCSPATQAPSSVQQLCAGLPGIATLLWWIPFHVFSQTTHAGQVAMQQDGDQELTTHRSLFKQHTFDFRTNMFSLPVF